MLLPNPINGLLVNIPDSEESGREEVPQGLCVTEADYMGLFGYSEERPF